MHLEGSWPVRRPGARDRGRTGARGYQDRDRARDSQDADVPDTVGFFSPSASARMRMFIEWCAFARWRRPGAEAKAAPAFFVICSENIVGPSAYDRTVRDEADVLYQNEINDMDIRASHAPDESSSSSSSTHRETQRDGSSSIVGFRPVLSQPHLSSHNEYSSFESNARDLCHGWFHRTEGATPLVVSSTCADSARASGGPWRGCHEPEDCIGRCWQASQAVTPVGRD